VEGECTFPFDNLSLLSSNTFLQGVERRSAAKTVYVPDPMNDANSDSL
jgi:hypothetical protein